MASINDVAKRAKVGVSTVSKVLNNYTGVSQVTKENVLKAVKELNYIPNSAASALSSKNGKRIAVVVFVNNQRQAIDEINMLYLLGSMNKAKELNLEVVTIFSNYFDDMEKNEIIHYFKSLSVQVVIVFGLNKEEKIFHEIIEQQHIKTVLVDAPICGDNTSYVMVDHQSAQYDIAKRMISTQEKSVKKVLYLAGRRDGYVTDLRLQGVVDACSEIAIDLDVHYADFSEAMAYKMTKEYGKLVDVIICASDLMAIGACNALIELGLYKPICGYDGIGLLAYTPFHILTVKQDFYRVAEEAIIQAKNLMQGNKGKAITMDYQITEVKHEEIIT